MGERKCLRNGRYLRGSQQPSFVLVTSRKTKYDLLPAYGIERKEKKKKKKYEGRMSENEAFVGAREYIQKNENNAYFLWFILTSKQWDV